MSLFERALGDRWRELPLSVRRLHSGGEVERFSGRARVTRGTGPVARLAAAVFGFPRPGEDVPVTVTMTRVPAAETWVRDFGGRRFTSVLSASPRPGHCRERFGACTYELELPVEAAAMSFPVRRGWLLGVPLPRFLLPTSCSREYAVDGVFHFDVGLYAPLTGTLVVRYRGHLRPDPRQGGTLPPQGD